VKLLITGASGFLGSRFATLLAERGHHVVATRRPGGRRRTQAVDAIEVDAGDPGIRELIAGCDAVFHFAGVPDPAKAAADPARAARENAGTTLNLLEGCAAHGAGLVYPSTTRAAVEPPPDAYAISKRLGEAVCRWHRAHAAVVRLTSVFGIGQVAGEGATGAIARFAAAALAGEPIVITGDAERTRDFVFADDLVPAFEHVVAAPLWDETVTLARGESTPLRAAADLVRVATGSSSAIETPGGDLAPGENESYEAPAPPAHLGFSVRPLDEGIRLYVDWLRSDSAPQGRSRA
jgi:UDP-glucose 4-epimerase